MAQKGIINDFYKQFEELNKKLDKANNIIFDMSVTISNQTEEIKRLNEIMSKKDELIEKLIEERDKYKNHSNKNSSNSGTPSSKEMFKTKETSPNEYNSRVKTGAKPGGQKGHVGSNLSKDELEKKIKENY